MTYLTKICSRCKKEYKISKEDLWNNKRGLCPDCISLDKEMREYAISYIQNNHDKSLDELREHLSNYYFTNNQFRNWLKHANYPIKKRIDRKPVLKYIKLNHRKDHKWLQEHIKSKFNIEVNLNTIRTWKREIGCLTDRRSIRRDWKKFLLKNYYKYSDSELKEIIQNKFQRNISERTIRHYRGSLNLVREKKKGLTVKEIRKCLYCGKDIEVTCRHPTKKFCNLTCFHKYRADKNHKRNTSIANNDNIKEFLNKWLTFAKSVLLYNKADLNNFEIEEVLTDFIEQIPSVIYWTNKHNYNELAIKRYIGKVMQNCVKRSLKKKHYINSFETSMDQLNCSDRLQYKLMG